MSNDQKRIIVLDISAFPYIESLQQENTEFVTLETFIGDSRQLWKDQQMKSSISKIRTQNPSNESLCIIKSFAQEAGEIENLTELDLLLMALVYDIEKEINGTDHINKIPLLDRSRYYGSTDQLREVGVNVCVEPCLYFSFPGGCSRGNSCFYRHPGDIDNRSVRRSLLSGLNPHAPSFTSKSVVLDDLKMEDILTPVPYQLNGSHVNGGDGHLVLTGEVGEEIAEDWVGADELASFDINVPDKSSKRQKGLIGCCTANFSMQNILIQMGFYLLSFEGKPITKLKIWTRKCSVCYRVCKNDSIVYCPFCGNRSLKRVQAFINNHGVVGVKDFPFPERKPKKSTQKQNKKRSCVCSKQIDMV